MSFTLIRLGCSLRSHRWASPSDGSRSSSVARDVFARRGYHAAKIDDIVAAAGIARGTFYLYFEDKRAIFEEIVDRTIARLGMTIVRVDPHDGTHTVADQVRDNIRRIVRILLEDRATTKILLSDALGVDPDVRPQAPLVLRRDVEPARTQPAPTGRRSASSARATSGSCRGWRWAR